MNFHVNGIGGDRFLCAIIAKNNLSREDWMPGSAVTLRPSCRGLFTAGARLPFNDLIIWFLPLATLTNGETGRDVPPPIDAAAWDRTLTGTSDRVGDGSSMVGPSRNRRYSRSKAPFQRGVTCKSARPSLYKDSSNVLRQTNKPVGYVARVQGKKKRHASSPLSIPG
jgi:hypothetical protein